jgi:hypothetical protein
VDALTTLLRDKFKYDGAHLLVLSEQPKTGEDKSTADVVRATLGRLATAMTPADQLIVLFIGHGGGDGADAKFNLVGADLTVTQWKELLQPIKGRLAIIDTTSSSFAYLTGLAAPNRVVMTATNSYAQKYHTIFPEQFIKALSDPTADQDKDGRISLLEAFTYASRGVKQYYEQKGTMATESPALDDTGDGNTRVAGAAAPAAGASHDGEIAALTYFEGVVLPTSSDPEVQRLLARQRELTEQIDELRRKRPSMTAEEYDQQFEKLALELATVSADVRKRTTK